jgi:hypothetical protein
MYSRIFISKSNFNQFELIVLANSHYFCINLIEGMLDIMPTALGTGMSLH